jgi:hypothetical protein
MLELGHVRRIRTTGALRGPVGELLGVDHDVESILGFASDLGQDLVEGPEQDLGRLVLSDQTPDPDEAGLRLEDGVILGGEHQDGDLRQLGM